MGGDGSVKTLLYPPRVYFCKHVLAICHVPDDHRLLVEQILGSSCYPVWAAQLVVVPALRSAACPRGC